MTKATRPVRDQIGDGLPFTRANKIASLMEKESELNNLAPEL
jgi:hypothetical protein